jgi:hypothetical protein
MGYLYNAATRHAQATANAGACFYSAGQAMRAIFLRVTFSREVSGCGRGSHCVDLSEVVVTGGIKAASDKCAVDLLSYLFQLLLVESHQPCRMR